MAARAWPSVNTKAEPLVKALIADADALRVDVSEGTLGECRIDCGVNAVGGLEAGRRIGPRSASAVSVPSRSPRPIPTAPGRLW